MQSPKPRSIRQTFINAAAFFWFGLSKEQQAKVVHVSEFIALCFVIFVISLLCSCGKQPDYTTRHGIDVYEQPVVVDRADIEYITDVALELWPTDVEGAILRLRNEPIESLWSGGCEEENGTFNEGTMTVWATQDECFARTSYGHELLHLLHWVHDDWRDYGTHEELRELNRKLWRRTVKDMCNDD
jgi:hypothetical protein